MVGQSPEIPQKQNNVEKPQKGGKEASSKKKSRKFKKSVKGRYYLVADFERRKQQERKFWGKIGFGLIEPIAMHVKAVKLERAMRAYRKTHGEDPILTDVFVHNILSRQKDFASQEANLAHVSQANAAHHVVMEMIGANKKNVMELTPEEDKKAREILQSIFAAKGKLSDEAKKQIAEKAKIDVKLVEILAGQVSSLTEYTERSGIAFKTPEEMQQALTDQLIYAGLTPEQQQKAKQVAHLAPLMTAFGIGRIAAVPVVGMFAPLGLASAAVVGGVAGIASRISTLGVQGATFGVNKERQVTTHAKNAAELSRPEKWFAGTRLAHWLSVDWEKDHKGQQLFRAMVAGAAIGVAFHFLPDVIGGAAHELGQAVNAGEHFAAQNHLFGMTDSSHHVAAVSEHVQHMQNNTPEIQNDPSQHITHYEQSVHQSYLPDTANHDWQQLHTIVKTDSHGNNYLDLHYGGVDDGGQTHYIDVMMPGGKEVFLQNDAVLAMSGPHATDLVHVYGFDHSGHFGPIGDIQSANLAHQLGLDQGRIDHFADVTKFANEHWPGTKQASDLQTILHNSNNPEYHLDNGANGNYLFGARLGGGYFDNNGFHIGASNQYYDNSLLRDDVYLHAQPVPTDIDVPMHSVIAPELTHVDTWEDSVLSRFGLPEWADRATDFGLNNTDALAAFASPNMPGYEIVPIIAAPYLISFAGGLGWGRYRKGKKAEVLPITASTAAQVGLLYALPGASVTTGLGYLLGRALSKKKNASAEEQVSTTQVQATTPVSTNDQVVPAVTPLPETVNSDLAATPQELIAAAPVPEAIGEEDVPVELGVTPPPPIETSTQLANESNTTPEVVKAGGGAVEATIAQEATTPLTQEAYLSELQTLEETIRKDSFGEEKEEVVSDLFYRMNDALLSGRNYIDRNGHPDNFTSLEDLVKKITDDFALSDARKQAIQKYATSFENLQERVVYESALQLVHATPEKISFEEFIAHKNTTEDQLRQAYEGLQEEPTDEKQQAFALLVAEYMRLGVPYITRPEWIRKQVGDISQVLFETDFINKTAMPSYVEAGNGQETSMFDDMLQTTLVKNLKEKGKEITDELSPQEREEVLTSVAGVLAENKQLNETAKMTLKIILDAYLLQYETATKYPAVNRPFFTLR